MIETRELIVEFRDKKVLDRVDLVIKPNQLTCIIGPNGAGKTTLLRVISKLVKYRGSILIDGYEVSKTPLRVIARLLSYVESFKTSEFLNMTVIDALITAQYPATRGFIERRECFERAERVLEQLGLSKYIYRRLGELSSGELQRIALAIGLVKNPRYMLFDEVDLHIDIGFKKTLVKLLREWVRDKTIVFTTHDLVFASIIGDYFIVLSNGRVVFSGDKQSLLNKVDLLKEVFKAEIILVKHNDITIPLPVYY